MAEILCANGWAQPPDGLSILAPEALHLDYRECRDFTCTTGLIATLAPRVQRAIGWSLGGSLLMQAIARGGLQAKQLVLIAPPVQFVSSEVFPHGMDRLTFDLFYQNYRNDPARTAARFSGLIAKGDRQSRQILHALGEWEGSHQAEIWHPWLDLLNEQSFDDYLISHLPPTLIIHGEKDAIVSIKQSEAFAAHVPQVTLQVWHDSGHAPHLHDLAGVRAAIADHARQLGLA
jgi:pimeloyl-[acyl-carrier protein] methyl ester esterase